MKKLLCVLLCISMVFGSFAVSASAASPDDLLKDETSPFVTLVRNVINFFFNCKATDISIEGSGVYFPNEKNDFLIEVTSKKGAYVFENAPVNYSIYEYDSSSVLKDIAVLTGNNVTDSKEIRLPTESAAYFIVVSSVDGGYKAGLKFNIIRMENSAEGNEIDENDPATWDNAKIAEYYNEARKATVSAGAPAGYQTMDLIGELSMGGTFSSYGKLLTPLAKSALADNSESTDYIPGDTSSDILEYDIEKAVAYKDADGNIVITMTFCNQIDGPDGDPANGGPVSRGIGTLGSIGNALEELGATIKDGRDTIKLTYDNAYIRECVINPETKTIKQGDYHYNVNVKIDDITVLVYSTPISLTDFEAIISYSVKVG